MDRGLDARFLLCMTEVIRHGSVREAARALGLPASLISRRISDVEIRYGVPLFERLPRGIIPTEAGLAIAEYARQQIDETQKIVDYLSNRKAHRVNQISIHCGDGFVEDLMETVMMPFSDLHPDTRVRITVGSTDEIRQAVIDGTSDIGLSYNMEDFNGVSSIVSTHKPLFAILSSRDITDSTHRLTIDDIVGRKLALPTSSHGIRKLLKNIELNHGIHIFPEMESNSFRLLKTFVMSGRGITFMPRFAVRAEIDQGRLVAIPIESHLCEQASVHLFVRSQRTMSVTMRRLINFMKDNLESLSPGATRLREQVVRLNSGA
ncbi:LysR family transcriptional regulator [Gluconacetobacter azotocaptans]|nr:LysR family transcriptional regulator [Gluconacetobacter azotocaptans]